MEPHSHYRFLFVKTSLVYPRSSGHDVHTFYMMRALADLGHEVELLTVDPVEDQAVAGGGLAGIRCFDELPSESDSVQGLSYLQRKFQSYWGIPGERINQVSRLAAKLRCDAVVVVGLDVLPYLAAVKDAKRIWYAADEWLYHHLTQVFFTDPSSWSQFKPGLIKGVYEFAYAAKTDRTWVVSEADARAVRWVMPGVSTDVIPNGVDTDHYHPSDVEPIPASCTMWGRLDFGPNIDALRWFATKVWSRVKVRVPDAKFDVFGFQPTEDVLSLARQYEFTVTPNLPDLREQVSRRGVVVLPFVSGGGIKNKFLEAASMGKAIVVSPRGLNGVQWNTADDAFLVANSAEEWIESLVTLWEDPMARQRIGTAARAWVKESYSWKGAADRACRSMRIGGMQ